jgi:hypothetical protein
VPPCLRHRGGLGVGLCARDRAGLRLPGSLPHPAPSRFNRSGQIKETLASKLDIIAKLAGKFLLEQGRPLTGNTMLAGDPGRTGMLGGLGSG